MDDHYNNAIKGTVSYPSLVYFLKFCQILAMNINVREEISSMDLNLKSIHSLQTNICPGYYN